MSDRLFVGRLMPDVDCVIVSVTVLCVVRTSLWAGVVEGLVMCEFWGDCLRLLVRVVCL